MFIKELPLTVRVMLVFAFVFAGFLSIPCRAQENPGSQQDAEGCTDLTIFPKLPASFIESCRNSALVEVNMPLKPSADGNSRERKVSGNYEFREYALPQGTDEAQAFGQLIQLLPIAGFTVKYVAEPATISARKEDTWILIQISGESYNVTLVKGQPESWTSVKNAEEISREIELNSRVAIYGINFSPDNQTIVEEKSSILGEVLKCLKANPKGVFVVESHKMSEVGSSENDQEITGRRAKAVVSWLEAHGIAAGRLQPKGLGGSKPITENDTESEIRRNERIVLIKNPA